MTSSNKCQQPKPKDGSWTLQDDHPHVRRPAEATSSFQKSQQICQTNPLLAGLLEGDELGLQHLVSSTSSVKKTDTVGLESTNPPVKGHMSQKGTTVLVSSRCGQTRTPDPSATHCGHFQTNVLHSSLGTDPSTYSCSAVDVDRRPPQVPLFRTNAEVLELINERVASFRARRHKPDHKWPNLPSVPLQSTSVSSNKKDATMQSFSCSLTKQGTIAAGQAFEADRLTSTRANPKFTSTCDKSGNILAFKHSKGRKTSSVGVGPHEIIDQCMTVGRETAANNPGDTSWDKENVSLNVVKFQPYEDVSDTEEPGKQHQESQVAAIFGEMGEEHPEGTTTSAELRLSETLDQRVTAGVDPPRQTSAGSKCVWSQERDVQTSRSEKVNHKRVTNIVDVNHVGHSLTALKGLVARLDAVVTNAKTDNVSEVLLQQYWNGDRDNIDVFEATEYPQIMLEVAAACTRHEEESPTVIQVSSPGSSLCSHLPQEDRTSWTSVSTVTRHTTATDQGSTGLKPQDTGSVQSVTAVDPQPPREQGTSADKQNNAKGMESCKEVLSNSKQSSSMQNICSEQVPLRDENRGQQLLPVSDCPRAGETVLNNHGATSLDKNTFFVSVVKVPQYEDVSDTEDPVQQHEKHKESQFAALVETISDDENLQTANTVRPSEDSPSTIQSHDQVESRSWARLSPESPLNCCCPYYIETVTGFEHVLCPKCEGERRTNESRIPSTVLKKTDESDDERDDCLAIPLKEDGQVEPDDVNHEGGHIGTPNPVAVWTSPLLEVLDATDNTMTLSCSHIPPPVGKLEVETEEPHSSRNPSCESDTCETEDSCDYMPTQGRNYLTVSQQAWKKLPAPSPPQHEDKRTRLHLNQKRRRQKSSTKTDKSNLGSDSEDENDSGAKMSKKRKKPIPPRSEDIGATSVHLQKRHSSGEEEEVHCETVGASTEQLSRCPQEPSGQTRPEGGTELVPGRETEDSSDDANYNNAKKSSASSSDSGGDDGMEEDSQREATQHLGPSPQHQSQVGQAIEAPGASAEPPASRETKQSLKLMTGPAPLNTNQERTPEGNQAAYKAKTKGKTSRKARRAARIYSDSSEEEQREEAFPDGSESLHVNTHRNTGQIDGTHHVQPKANLLPTSKTMNTDDEVEKDTRTAERPETEDREDDFSDPPDSSTLHNQNKRLSHKEAADKHPQCADGTSPSLESCVINRLYVQESPSNQRLQISKQFPVQTHGADGQARGTANTNPATMKKADSKWQASQRNRRKDGNLVPKSKSSMSPQPAAESPSGKPSTSAPTKHRQPMSRSFSSPATSGLAHPYPKKDSLPSSAHSSAWDKVKGIWKDQFVPIPVHKKASLGTEDQSKSDGNPVRDTEPGPSNPSKGHRRRHCSLKSETPLMKKTKSEAKERTRDINHNPQRRHTGPAVAGHYKWKSRRERRECEGSRRQKTKCPSSPELDWD